jgi:hypothetical protein
MSQLGYTGRLECGSRSFTIGLLSCEGGKCLESFCTLFPGADLYTLFYAPDRVSSLIKSMNVRASLLNDLPVIEHIYRYCLSLFPTLIESFNLRDYGLILSPRLNLRHVLLLGKTFRISQVRQSTVNALFSLVVGGSQRTNEFTAIIERDGECFIAYRLEIPSGNGQGRTKQK